MNTNKREARTRRAGRTRHQIRRLDVNRLTVFRSSNHMYAQVFSAGGEKVLASASTLDKEVADENERLVKDGKAPLRQEQVSTLREEKLKTVVEESKNVAEGGC